MAAPTVHANAYEQQREERIAKNMQRFAEAGLGEIVHLHGGSGGGRGHGGQGGSGRGGRGEGGAQAHAQQPFAQPPPRKRPSADAHAEPARRSGRIAVISDAAGADARSGSNSAG